MWSESESSELDKTIDGKHGGCRIEEGELGADADRLSGVSSTSARSICSEVVVAARSRGTGIIFMLVVEDFLSEDLLP